MVVSEDRLIYSIDKCIEILVNRDDMTPEDALEYLEFNTLGAYVGKDQPVFLREYEE